MKASRQKASGIGATIHEIWLAGLGAFTRTQEEAGRVFDELVKEGEAFQARTRKDIDERVKEVRDEVEEQIDKARSTASGNVHKLEQSFEDRVARLLARFGVPTADEVNRLTRRVEQLSRQVKALRMDTAPPAPRKAA